MKIRITPKDPKLAKNPAVKKWLLTAEKRVEEIIEKSEQYALERIKAEIAGTKFKIEPEQEKFREVLNQELQMMSDIYAPPIENGRADMKKYVELGKRLKHFKPDKRSKLSYRGDHYQT